MTRNARLALLALALFAVGVLTWWIVEASRAKVGDRTACADFEAAYHLWHERYGSQLEGKVELTEADHSRLEQAAAQANARAADDDVSWHMFLVSDSGGHEQLLLDRSGSAVKACMDAGEPTEHPELTDAQWDLYIDNLLSDTPSRASRPAPSSDEQRALEMLWEEMSSDYREATCLVYEADGSDFLDSFMREAGARFTESTVRSFYDDKCSG